MSAGDVSWDPAPGYAARSPIGSDLGDRLPSSQATGETDTNSAADTSEGASMGHLVNAELVANVLRVVARAGDKVAADDTLVILESMKMEIPVHAEVAGTVTEIAVNEGDVVTEGELLAEIEEAWN
jgi:biotin carboxyl carrier protein